MQTLDTQVRRFRRRVALFSALAMWARGLVLFSFLWGTAVMALRAGFDAPRGLLLWGLAGALPIAAAALVLGLRRRPAAGAVRALLDRHSAGGGLVMAAGEVELGGWRDRIGGVTVPRLAGRYPWGPLGAGAAFVAAAFLVPVAPAGPLAERPLQIGDEVARLTERVELLEQEGLLAEAEAERFARELESLREEASGEDPAVTWEALDHLQELTDGTAAEVAEAALTEGEQLAAAAAVAEALSEAGDEAGGELMAEAMAELSALTARAAAESRLLEGTLAAELGAAASDQLDLGRLLDALERGQGSLSDKLDRLHAGGLIDLETLLTAQRSLEGGDLDQLADFLEDNGLEAAGGYCRGGRPGTGRPGAGQGSRPGRGGVSRGRGDAPMTWKDPSPEEGAKWRPQVLDPSSLAALRQSHLLGLTAADPGQLEPDAPIAAGAGLDPQPGGGGGATTHTLLPRHRGAVRRYFDRDSERDP